jgi:hypothetical protein
MVLTLIAALSLVSDPIVFSEDPEDHSVWMQHACRIQQVDRSGGEPEDHEAFCGCFDAHLRDNTSAQVYRLFAMGSQGVIQDRSMLDDWEAARDQSAAESETLAPEDQAGMLRALQGGLGACLGL